MAFNINNYYLKYYYEGTDRNGHSYRLEILQKSSTAFTPKEIGDFQTLVLNIQGSQAAVDDPIVKTSLTFSMVDSYDKADTATTKYGNWGEFYTPDSTKYLVVLKRGSTVRWRGYITPDSWEEDLDYYGSISVTARDNIGHLQDFEFDATGSNGLLTVFQLINAAFAKIDFPMTLGPSFSDYLEQNGKDIRSHYLNLKVFEGKDWYEVLETILADLGLCLRFVDDAEFCYGNIKDLERVGQSYGTDKWNVTFLSGKRSLSPAWKQVINTINYDFEPDLDLGVETGLEFPGSPWTANFSMPYQTKGPRSQSGTITTTGEVTEIDTASIGWRVDAGRQDTNGGTGVAYLGANLTSVNRGWHRYTFGSVKTGNMSVKMHFAPMAKTWHTTLAKFITYRSILESMQWTMYYYYNSQRYYYDATEESWSTTEVWNEWTNTEEGRSEFEVTPAMTLPDGTQVSQMTIYFKQITFKGFVADLGYFGGFFLAVDSIVLSCDDSASKVESNKVTMVNSTTYNVTSTKEDKIGALSRDVGYISPLNYKNVLLEDSNTIAGYYWNWHSTQGTSLPLPSLIQLQRLAFHSTPLPVLEGDCVMENRSYPFKFNCLYKYKGVEYLLTSGSLDIVSGIMRDVQLYGLEAYTPAGATYVIENPTVQYSTGSSINAAGSNYAYITATVKVYQGETLIDTRSNVTLTPTAVDGTDFHYSGTQITADNRHKVVGAARTANVTVSYNGTAYGSPVTVTQQANTRSQQTQSIKTTTGFSVVTLPTSVGPNGGTVNVYGTRTYDLTEGTYVYTSGEHDGGTVTHGHTESSYPDTVSCPGASVSGHTVTIPARTQVTTPATYTVLASLDGFAAPGVEVSQSPDTIVSTTQELVYSASCQIDNPSLLTAAGGQTTVSASASHTTRDVYTWQSGGQSYGQQTTVQDNVTLSLTGRDTSRFHLSGNQLVHDNMTNRTSDLCTVVAINASHPQTTDSDAVQITNVGHVQTPYNDYALSPMSSYIGSGAETMPITCSAYHIEKTIWDSGYIEITDQTELTVELAASPDASMSPTSITGSGSSTFSVAANPSTSAREITITMQRLGETVKTVTITQDGSIPAPKITLETSSTSSRTTTVFKSNFDTSKYCNLEIVVTDNNTGTDVDSVQGYYTVPANGQVAGPVLQYGYGYDFRLIVHSTQ